MRCLMYTDIERWEDRACWIKGRASEEAIERAELERKVSGLKFREYNLKKRREGIECIYEWFHPLRETHVY